MIEVKHFEWSNDYDRLCVYNCYTESELNPSLLFIFLFGHSITVRC
jgi:hypothetical protein